MDVAGQLLLFDLSSTSRRRAYDATVAMLDDLEGFRHPPGHAQNEYERTLQTVHVAEDDVLALGGTPSVSQLHDAAQTPDYMRAANGGRTLACSAWVYTCQVPFSATGSKVLDHGDWREYMRLSGEQDCVEPFGAPKPQPERTLA